LLIILWSSQIADLALSSQRIMKKGVLAIRGFS